MRPFDLSRMHALKYIVNTSSFPLVTVAFTAPSRAKASDSSRSNRVPTMPASSGAL